MVDYAALRKKYPKWAHRHAYHRKRRRRSRSRSRRRRRRARAAAPSTNVLLLQLLHQIMGGAVRPLARKHGENVVTGYAGAVTPDRLAPLRSRDEYARAAIVGQYGPWRGVGAGAAAAAGQAAPRRAPMPT